MLIHYGINSHDDTTTRQKTNEMERLEKALGHNKLKNSKELPSLHTTTRQKTNEMKRLEKALIPTEDIIVDIMDEVIMSPRRQELQAKFMEAMKANPEWFLQQQKLVEQTGKGISYDPHLGMTEAEWEEFEKLDSTMNDMQVVSSGTAKITVTKTNDIISFKTDDKKLSSLNLTTIDIKKNSVKIFDYLLTLVDTICVTNSDNIFKSEWRGYKWEFSEPSNLTMPTSQEALQNLSMKLYGFTLGLFEKTGKTYIEISGTETDKGMKIPQVLQK